MTLPAERTDLTVIGAGPAGLAAAVEAARCGVRTTIVDAGARVGGQFWRHGPGGLDLDLHHDVPTYTDLVGEMERLIVAGRITHLPEHHVWTVTMGADGCSLRAIDRRDPAGPVEVVVDSDYLILAVGGYDRQVPFPGWDLPGVMTVGAAQSLLKGSGVVVGPRVLVAGTGPFLLPVAAGLAVRGATVVCVHEANHPAGWLRHVSTVAAQRRKIGEAAAYAVALGRHRVPIRHRSVVVAAHGVDQLEAVTVGRLDRSGAVRAATLRRIRVDVLAVGHGFTAQTELALQAGCATHTTTDHTLAVTTDDEQVTTHRRVYAAGEATGIGGAQLAVAEGTIAGAAAARAAGRLHPPDPQRLAELMARRDGLRRFADAMHAVYPIPSAWLDTVQPDTIVCRCEEVTVADIAHAVDLGARDTRTVRLLSRSGMGWCQGRVCGYATACLLARRTGQDPNLANGAERPVASPIPLGLLAGPTAPRT